jgi:hypothetical protein
MSHCPQCGTPAAPSWSFCPRCSSSLTDDGEVKPSTSTVGDDTDQREVGRASDRRWLTGMRRVLPVGSVVTAFVVIAVLITNIVSLHNHLANEKTQLKYGRGHVQVLNASLQAARAQQAGFQNTDHVLAQALEGTINLLQGFATANSPAAVISLPRAHGVGGSLIFTPPPPFTTTRVDLTVVVNETIAGETYGLAYGSCPDDLIVHNSSASAVADSSRTLMIGPITVPVPNMGSRSWFRLYQLTALSWVPLGGVLGPFLPGPGGDGTPILANQTSC